MTEENLDILTNIIGAVETGGQIYGKRRYNQYTPPYTNTKLEHTITLGWAGFYGAEARKLVQMIYDIDPQAFKKIDSDGKIQNMLSKDWVAMKWNPSPVQRSVLIQLIDSPAGHKAQDELFKQEMKQYIADCEKDYPGADTEAQMMYCEIRHLGGKSAANRIFKRCNGNYSLNNIMSALKQDQNDTSSSNQVGDKLFWSRHEKCKEFIEKYVGKGEQMATPLERAKIFLRQTSLKSMTGYTPTGSSCFKKANAWTTTPKKGYVVYFWGKPSGESNKRICHVGIVESVNTSNKTFGTIEGNTSSSQFTTNGGCVARHTYSYASVGGSNRVNGFGIPNFADANITADEFVNVAKSYIGYEEKKSNAYLDDFHKNAGRNNYQKFQRDVVGYTGDQWCQYFVDACALYAAQGSSGHDDKPVKQDSVLQYQKFLNTYYPEYVKGVCNGELLKEDNDYGPRTRGASVAVWKYMANKYISPSPDLSVKSIVFASQCRRVAENFVLRAGYKEHPTLVNILQGCLAGLGYYDDNIDGSYGNNTVAGVEAFQKKRGIGVDGICGPNTWYELFN